MTGRKSLYLAAGALALPLIAFPAFAQGAVGAEWRWLTFAVFAAIIGLTMFVTYIAAKRVKSAADFYTAGGGVSGLQNGWAIAGDYLSAASFLGIAGLISLYGYDGFLYSVGWLVAYITVLLVIAEPCRNIGKYTLADILAYRNNPRATRIVGALSVITVSTFYLTAQMVGGGVLVKTLIGIDYTYPGCDLPCARALETTINEVGADKVAAFIAEPVVGAAGGVLVPPPEYWTMIRDICSRHDVLLIADEVITGFGRTGKPFAVNHWGVLPDMITMAKGISAGYAALGAVAVSSEIRGVFEEKSMPFDHVFTFMANPISTAAAHEALKIWEEENLCEHAARMGEYLFRQLDILKKHEMVGDIRGLGLMAGVEFVADRISKEPFPAEKSVSKLVGKIALQNGLVTYPGGGMVEGTRGDIIRCGI